MTGPAPSAVEVAELRALVTGREDPEVVRRLGAVVGRLAAGEALGDEDGALVSRLRHEYGHERAELADPEE